jgi:hypothetical protein
MDTSKGQAGAISSHGTSEPSCASGRAKAADAPFSDYEYEMAMLETELELEWEMASRTGDTD